MSGGGDWERIERARELGFRVFSKPFSFAELMHWLDECETRILEGRVLRDLDDFDPRDG